MQPRVPGIMQVIPELNAGGAERSCIEIALAVARAGWRSYIATRGGRLESELAGTGVVVLHMPAHAKNPLVMLENYGRLRSLIRRHDISIVHARSRAPAWSAYRAARSEGIPFVTTYHGKVAEGPSWKVRYNSVMARGSAVIANSEFTAERILRVHGAPTARVHTIQRGFDLSRFDPANVDKAAVAALRETWRAEDRPVVLLPGRLTRWKGQLLLLDAATRVETPAQYVLAGDAQGRDDYVRELQERIRYQDLGARVTVAGHVDDMPTAYAAADIVVSASLEPEPFGRTTVEGMAMARPVIAPDHGGAREQVIEVPEDQRTGWLFEPGDAAALAAAIDAALRLPADKRAQIGGRGRIHATMNFTADAMATRTLGVYEDILGR